MPPTKKIREGEPTHVQRRLAVRGGLQARLKEVIDKLAPGDEVVITDDQQPVAKLVDARPAERKLGTMRGTVRYMAPDFDAPLDDFREYMD